MGEKQRSESPGLMKATISPPAIVTILVDVCTAPAWHVFTKIAAASPFPRGGGG